MGTAWTAAAVDGVPGAPVPSPEVIDGRFLAELLGGLGSAGALVCAVPDHWLHGGARGALERERLDGLLAGCGLPPPVFLGHGEAVVAGCEGVFAVCDAGTDAVCVTLCLAEGGEMAVADSERAGVECYERRLADGRPVAEFAHALRREVLERPERAGLVLPRARELDRYRATPVYEPLLARGRARLTAGQVLDGFEPVAAALRDAVAAMLSRHPGLEPEVVVAGGAGVPSLVRAAVVEGVSAAGRLPRGVREVGADAVARGAALIAAGTVRAREPGHSSVRLAGRRVAGGLLRSWEIPVAASGRGVRAVVEVMSEGRALEVESTPEPSPTAPGPTRAFPGSTVPAGRLAVAGPAVPEGPVDVTYWPDRRGGGVVVVRSDGGGPALAYVLEERHGDG